MPKLCWYCFENIEDDSKEIHDNCKEIYENRKALPKVTLTIDVDHFFNLINRAYKNA